MRAHSVRQRPARQDPAGPAQPLETTDKHDNQNDPTAGRPPRSQPAAPFCPGRGRPAPNPGRVARISVVHISARRPGARTCPGPESPNLPGPGPGLRGRRRPPGAGQARVRAPPGLQSPLMVPLSNVAGGLRLFGYGSYLAACRSHPHRSFRQHQRRWNATPHSRCDRKDSGHSRGASESGQR